MAISAEDPVNGVVVGSLDTRTVMASVHQQADGHVRAEFDSMAAHDPVLMARISRNYNRRMGR